LNREIVAGRFAIIGWHHESEGTMTKLLEKAFAAATKLPDQDALAGRILADLASEQHWDTAFASSADTLGALADEALAEHRAGETRVLKPERM
jgi:hypothetical protein